MRSAAAKLSAGGIDGDVVGGGAQEECLDRGGVEVVRLDGAAKAGVDGEVGGDGKGGRRGHARLGEEVEQRGVVFVDLAQRVFHLGQRLVENRAQDAVLLIGEERGERVGDGAEEAVDEADHLGKIGALDGRADVVGEGGKGRAVLRAVGGVAAHGGGEVLVAQVQHGEADLLVLLGDAGAQMGAADGDLAAAGGEALVGVAVQVEAEETGRPRGSCGRWS